MTSFKEFLEDYEKKESENSRKFMENFSIGKFSYDDIYPPKSRFIKLKEPLAYPPHKAPVWSTVPFYGSTIIPLLPIHDPKKFDEIVSRNMGFTSKDIDKMIDLVKNTGRIQFVLHSNSNHYSNLEFLEPIFTELNPPSIYSMSYINFLDKENLKKIREYCIEFDTLAKLGLYHGLEKHIAGEGVIGKEALDKTIENLALSYAYLKFAGYNDLADEIDSLMTLNPLEAFERLTLLEGFMVGSRFSTFKAIRTHTMEKIREVNRITGSKGVTNNKIPYDIGKFILNKMVKYPETYEGCLDIIQHYDDNELNGLLNALNEGVKQNNIDLVKKGNEELNMAFENVWQETKNVKRNVEIARFELGLLGSLSAGLTGTGILAGLGLTVVGDKILESKLDSFGEKFVKFFSPNYLISLYDFKKKHREKMYQK